MDSEQDGDEEEDGEISEYMEEVEGQELDTVSLDVEQPEDWWRTTSGSPAPAPWPGSWGGGWHGPACLGLDRWG